MRGFGRRQSGRMRVGDIFGALGVSILLADIFEDARARLDGILTRQQSATEPARSVAEAITDGVTFDVAIENEMRAEAGIKGGIVFEGRLMAAAMGRRVARRLLDFPAGLTRGEGPPDLKRQRHHRNIQCAAEQEGRLNRGEA